MELKLKFKPIYMTGSSKKNIVEQIKYGYIPIYQLYKGIRICGYYRKQSKTVRVYNLIKHNRKTQHDRDGNTIIIKPMYWEAFVYDIPLDVLDFMGLSIVQKERNFRVYKRY